MGFYGLPLVLAPVLGPTLGGYLVEYVDWRFIFTLIGCGNGRLDQPGNSSALRDRHRRADPVGLG